MHHNKPIPVEELAELCQYAVTDTDRRYLQALCEKGSTRSAAALLQVNSSSVDKALARMRKRAKASGWAPPERHPSPPRGPSDSPRVPVGHELAGLSSLVNADGTLNKAWEKTRVAGAVVPPSPIVPDGHHVIKTATLRRADGTTISQWVSASADESRREQEILAAWARHASVYAGLAGTAPEPDARTLIQDMIGVIPIGDPHIGMLAWEPESGDNFDTTIAVRELLCCMKELIDDMPATPRVIIGNLGDAMHAQDDQQLTPGHKHKLDVDGRYPKVLDALHVLLRAIIDYALLKFQHVTFRNLPGNHDPRVAVELMMWLRAVYENEPRVTIADAFAAHQYDHFGVNLIGWHHGDRSRKGELPAIMASDHDGGGTGLWGSTTEHVWHVGHEHHSTLAETPSCFVWIHNTLAARDAHHAGRYRAKRMLRGFVYHREYGEHKMHTVSLARVRAALARNNTLGAA